MKYIALLVVLGFMGWTWSLAQSDRDYGLAESREVENQIQQIITEYIQANRPNVKNIRFQQLFTEVIRPNQEMRVHVRYLVDETAGGDQDMASQTFQGVVLLKSTDGKIWQMAGQDMRAPVVEFRNGSRVDRSVKAGPIPTAAEHSHSDSKAPTDAPGTTGHDVQDQAPAGDHDHSQNSDDQSGDASPANSGTDSH